MISVDASHIQVIQDLGPGVNELTKLMKVLQNTVQISKGQRTLEERDYDRAL